ncbi:MAG TPA: glycosyltransferase family 39 protein [Streptosporangiaceae bacterium]|nr:glycosyltransferase family 39 protein [Streptosporangiaceae bacterium]
MQTGTGHIGLPEAGLSEKAEGPRRPERARLRWAAWLEALGVVLSPAVAAIVLRLRLMAPSSLPDPAIHTGYIIDPSEIFARYGAFFARTGRLREVARVGFLVPARLAYLAFGAVPGFFVTRYVFALVAVCPVYLLLRRLYGRPAGVAGILAVLSSPVIITAWGSDYPDSAVVAYAAGLLACLAMPCRPGSRRRWLAAAGILITLAVWSDGFSVLLAAGTLAGYVVVRLVRDRARLLGDLALLAGVGIAVTALLAGASAVVIGHANFIAVTWRAYRFLSQPDQTRVWHSANWRWVLYVPYVLVPPAVLGALTVAVARRRRAVPTPVLVVGAAAAGQLAFFGWMQFAGSVQSLEYYFSSSALWAAVALVLAITVAELAKPLSGRPLARWLPAAVLLAVPLLYEAAPRVPPFRLVPLGVMLAIATTGIAAIARGCARFGRQLVVATTIGLSLAALAGAALVLTVAPIPHHRHLPGTVPSTIEPAPPYASALGSRGTLYIDRYRIAAALPSFVGQPAYPGEQLLMWWPRPDKDTYIEDAGVVARGEINELQSQPPQLTTADQAKLGRRRPAELLLFDSSAASFPTALRNLAAYRPVLMRSGEFGAGPVVLHAWLIRLGVYYHPPANVG